MKNKHPVWTKLDWRGCRPLTLRELILKSNFDTMMDIIIDFDPKMSNQGGAFLRAVHCIRDMKVKANSEDYFLAKYDHQYNVPYIGVLEGIRWSEYLGYQVKRDKDLHCNDTVLAAHCLWHLTFYGYTPKNSGLISTDRTRNLKENAETMKSIWPTTSILTRKSRNLLDLAIQG